MCVYVYVCVSTADKLEERRYKGREPRTLELIFQELRMSKCTPRPTTMWDAMLLYIYTHARTRAAPGRCLTLTQLARRLELQLIS